MRKTIITFLSAILIAMSIKAQDNFDPIASDYAIPGGNINLFGGQFPKSFNYYLETSYTASEVFGLLYESLIGMDPITSKYTANIAKSWTISEDKKTFTFEIDSNAKWSDGKPITAEDIVWTFNAIMNPTNLTGPHKISLAVFKEPEIISNKFVRFTADSIHWRNLGAAGGFQILPKHAFKNKIFNEQNTQFPVVSGPYKLDEIKSGTLTRLKRRNNWWQQDYNRNQNIYNFDTITFRYYSDRMNAFEEFKKGTMDIFPVYTSRLWMKETDDDKFIKNWIVKQKITNHKPVGFQGFAMNMRREPFKDPKVRKALAHLVNREHMNKTLAYNQYFLHKSYYEDLYTDEFPCNNPNYEYNPAKAKKLLKEAGWKPNSNGILEKNGKEFTFKYLARGPGFDKYLAIYTEDLAAAGIKMEVDNKDWAAWMKDMDGFNFDMTTAAYGAGIFKDPESMWLSEEADRKSGNNITGFKNEKVDKLIEKQKSIFDVDERNAICREIDGILTESCPYVLLWNIQSTRLLYWNKFGRPDTILSKFGNESSVLSYWWLDPDLNAELKDAIEADDSLIEEPEKVFFDENFKE
ncbi:MAG: extracellular solute-binding protein [Kiritimatiellae bacterium]|jgi:microcin C transport system substrate-binding protein|nr:extracellular solute-binding protein [Kiritimatiellia bacterium]